MKILLLIDTSIFLHRSIYVEDYGGDPVWTFWQYVKSLKTVSKADEVIFTLDDTKMTFRHKLYLPYKAQRPDKTEEFKAFKDCVEGQIKRKYLWEGCKDFESDDYIGSLAVQYPGKVFIGSADLDLSQLVNDRITMLKPTKNKWDPEKPVNVGFEVVSPSYVVNRYGIFPDQIPDYKALAGDASDNIKLPIKGLGGVAAAKLLIMYDNIQGIYNHLDDEDFILPKFKEGLLQHKKQVDLFLQLTTIRKDLTCKSLERVL